MIKITFPDQSVREYEAGVTGLQIAESISQRLAQECIACGINGVTTELNRPITEDATINLYKFDDAEGKHAFWHTSAHLMAEAIEQLWPGTQFGIGPAIENGFYYDVMPPEGVKLSDADFPKIEKRMQELVQKNEPLIRKDIAKQDVLELFASIGVKFIICRSVGYDHVDLVRAAELGMRVANVEYPPSGVANYAIMLMMMCERNITQILKRAELQDFTLKGKIGHDLSFATVGVIGTGKIGSTVIKHLSGFGCRILCSDPYINEEAQKYAEYVDVDTLFRESDVITLHSNATDENYHLLDENAFSKMKDCVTIINTARGRLIDTHALTEALKSGKVEAAALDVLENEDVLYYYDRVGDVISNDEMAQLRSFPNVIMSPHTAFYTVQAVEHMVDGCFRGAAAFASGAGPGHEIRPQDRLN